LIPALDPAKTAIEGSPVYQRVLGPKSKLDGSVELRTLVGDESTY